MVYTHRLYLSNIPVLVVAVLYFHHIPWWGALIIAMCLGLGVALIVQFVLVPSQRKSIQGKIADADINEKIS